MMLNLLILFIDFFLHFFCMKGKKTRFTKHIRSIRLTNDPNIFPQPISFTTSNNSDPDLISLPVVKSGQMSFPKQATLLLHLCNAYQELLDDMFTSQFQLNIQAILGPGLKSVQDRFTLNTLNYQSLYDT